MASILVNPCGDPDPENTGRLGVVYLNGSRVDGVLNVEEPEALFYHNNNGKLQLAGVEYAVTQEAWHAIHGPDAELPEMFGLGPEGFHRNDNVGLYGIHVWWKDNPHGRFALEHPDVNCDSTTLAAARSATDKYHHVEAAHCGWLRYWSIPAGIRIRRILGGSESFT